LAAFMAVLCFFIVVFDTMVMARRADTVFVDPTPVKTCPACLSADRHPPIRGLRRRRRAPRRGGTVAPRRVV